MASSLPELYSAVQVAHLCQMSHSTIAGLIDRGELVGASYPGSAHKRVRLADLIEWLLRSRMYTVLEELGHWPRLLCVGVQTEHYEFLKFRPEGNRTLAASCMFEAGISFVDFRVCSVLFRLEGQFEEAIKAAYVIRMLYPGRVLGAILPMSAQLQEHNRTLFDQLFVEPFDKSVLLDMLPCNIKGGRKHRSRHPLSPPSPAVPPGAEGSCTA